jgi:hypothetical protein
MENLGIFYDHFDYFRAIGNILWPFGIFYGNLVYFPRFGFLDQEQSGNPAINQGDQGPIFCTFFPGKIPRKIFPQKCWEKN